MPQFLNLDVVAKRNVDAKQSFLENALFLLILNFVLFPDKVLTALFDAFVLEEQSTRHSVGSCSWYLWMEGAEQFILMISLKCVYGMYSKYVAVRVVWNGTQMDLIFDATLC